jgi:DNA topoisomerase-1
LSLKVSGKFGAFIGCSRYPDCRYTRQLSAAGNGTDAEASTPDGKILGYDPESGLAVALKVGRFGPYLQLGEASSKDEKPKRSSIPKGVDPNTIDLERALQLLSLPRHIGDHPETKKPITAGLGRFGPFILHDGTYANIPAEELFTVGINRAVALLAEKKAGKSGRFQRAAPTVLKELGEHPTEGGKIQVLSGRYGPYVKHGDVNATLPRSKQPEALTVDEAVQLIAERAAKGPTKGKARKGKSTTTKAARETAAPAQANGAPAKSKSKKNGKDISQSGADAPPAKGKPARSRKTAS